MVKRAVLVFQFLGIKQFISLLDVVKVEADSVWGRRMGGGLVLAIWSLFNSKFILSCVVRGSNNCFLWV